MNEIVCNYHLNRGYDCDIVCHYETHIMDDVEMGAMSARYIITGITKDGHIFRPSDWAVRICELYADSLYPLRYSKEIHPIYFHGRMAIAIFDDGYEDVLKFAEDNNLVVYYHD